MIINIGLSRLNSDGMRVCRSLNEIGPEILGILQNTPLYFDLKPLNYIKFVYRHLYINTILFTLTESDRERVTVFALHLITDRMLINIEGILKGIAVQLQSRNILITDLGSLKNALETKADHFESDKERIIIDWECDTIGGTDEIWS